ncbi:MAG: hypothetical protein MUF87_19585 [Anaerolineae bacterium]|jgi:anti-sigma factor RsiW|nr:hypothetical protein [Anaerolineae bacterium]
MVLAFFRYRYCKAHMVAYLHGELSPQARRRIGRIIDHDPACYAEYVRQRDLMAELDRQLPLVGQADPRALRRMWGAIQQELQGHHAPMRRLRWRYGVAGVLLMMILVMPLTMGNSQPTLARSLLQPAPQTEHVSPDTATAANTVWIANNPIEVTPPAPQHPQTTPTRPADR